ncbi:MAG TPA: inorganic phosphate transporter [Candidatus Acetothermia bacterium]|nr:inorganic phosphate transporter [Candidatus Acetothermia bacterium]
MWTLIAGLFMGWSLGANDAANLFGPIVASAALRFWTAASVAAAFVLVGAVTVGSRGFAAYEAIGAQTLISSFLIMVAAGLTVTLMTFLGLPVSSTQAVVGAIVGAALIAGGVSFQPLVKIFVSWVLTPLGGMIAAFIPYKLLIMFPRALPARLVTRNSVIRVGLILVTCYSAYSLGANNVANVTGVYVGAGVVSPFLAALIGALAIGTGILTFSRRVVRTVGNRIVSLDHLTALIVVLAEAITLNVYALIGVPVSASQAVVGAVLGIGLVKGVKTIDGRVLVRVLFGWIGTPAIAGAISAGLGLFVGLFD